MELKKGLCKVPGNKFTIEGHFFHFLRLQIYADYLYMREFARHFDTPVWVSIDHKDLEG